MTTYSWAGTGQVDTSYDAGASNSNLSQASKAELGYHSSNSSSGNAPSPSSPSSPHHVKQPERTVPPEATISSKSLQEKMHAHFRGLKKKIPIWQAKQILKEQGYKVAEKGGQLEATKKITRAARAHGNSFNPTRSHTITYMDNANASALKGATLTAMGIHSNLLNTLPPNDWGDREIRWAEQKTKDMEKKQIIPENVYSAITNPLKMHHYIMSKGNVNDIINAGTSVKNSLIGMEGMLLMTPGVADEVRKHPKAYAESIVPGAETIPALLVGGAKNAIRHPFKTIPGDLTSLLIFKGAGDALSGAGDAISGVVGEAPATIADQAAAEAPGALPDDVLNTLADRHTDIITTTQKITPEGETKIPSKLTPLQKTERFSVDRTNRVAKFTGEKPSGGEEIARITKIKIPTPLKPTGDIGIYPSVEPHIDLQGIPRIMKTELTPEETGATAHFYGHLERPQGDYAILTKEDLSTQVLGEKPKATFSETKIGQHEKVVNLNTRVHIKSNFENTQTPSNEYYISQTPGQLAESEPHLFGKQGVGLKASSPDDTIQRMARQVHPKGGFRDALVTEKNYYEFTTPDPLKINIPEQHLFGTEDFNFEVPQEKILNTPHWMDVTEKKYYDIDTGKVIARDKILTRAQRGELPKGFQGKGKGGIEQWKYTKPKNYEPGRPFSQEHPDELGGKLKPEAPKRSPEEPRGIGKGGTGGSQRSVFRAQASESQPEYQLDFTGGEISRLKEGFNFEKAGTGFKGGAVLGLASGASIQKNIHTPKTKARQKLPIKTKIGMKGKGRQFDNILDLNITVPKLDTGLKNRLKLGIKPDLSFATDTDTFTIQKTKQKSKQKQDTKTNISVPTITIPDFTPFPSLPTRSKLSLPKGSQKKSTKKSGKRRILPGYLRWELLNPWATANQALGISGKKKGGKAKKVKKPKNKRRRS